MKSFLDLSRTRQSCRSFSGERIDRAKLEMCVEAARLAPSGCNAQPWSFVVVDDPTLLPEVAKCAQSFNGINQFTNKASAFVVILEEHAQLMPAIASIVDSQYFAKGDLGAASYAICLAAADLGLGACQIGFYDRPRLCELLGIPSDKAFGAFIALGVPAESPREKVRKPAQEVVRFV